MELLTTSDSVETRVTVEVDVSEDDYAARHVVKLDAQHRRVARRERCIARRRSCFARSRPASGEANHEAAIATVRTRCRLSSCVCPSLDRCENTRLGFSLCVRHLAPG